MRVRLRTRCRTFGQFFTPIVVPFLVVALSIIPNLANAQWMVEPVLSVGFVYDDNTSLNRGAENEVSADGYNVEGNARISYATQLSRFSITPMLRVTRFGGLSRLDSEDKFLDFDYRYSGQLSEFRFRGDLSEESVRTAERSDVDLDVDDPDDIAGDDSGLVVDTDDRRRIVLTPEFRRRIGEKASILLRLNYIDLSYDDDVFGLLQDYTRARILGRYDYKWTQRDSFTIGAYYRNSEFEGRNDASGNGASLGYTRDLSQTSKFILRAGVDSTEDANGEDQTNPIFEASFIRNFQTSRLLASYRRSINGGGAGVLSVRDAVSINMTREMSERITIGAGLRAYQTDALDGNTTTFDERDYVQIRGLLSWRLTRQFSVDFDYRHTYLDRSTIVGDASSNRFNLWFRWAPKRQ